MLVSFDEVPNPVKYESALNTRFKINGNSKAIKFIIHEVTAAITNQMDLYQAQESIIQKVKDTFGELWYEANAEAVNFMVENGCTNAFRKEQPFYDAKELYAYEHDTMLY